MTIRTEQLSSSWIMSATYDSETEDLSITTSNGGTYDHHGVPETVFEGFISASSPGKFWWANIKDKYD